MIVAIVDYGVGNRMSVRVSLERLGAECLLTRSPELLRSADAVVLPGVGSAGPAMESLVQAGLFPVLRSLQQPVLGICLGLQLLADFLDEGSVAGLGLIPGRVRHLADLVPGATGPAAWPAAGLPAGPAAAQAAAQPPAPIPHMGWTPLQPAREGAFSDPLLKGIAPGTPFYFAHSYALDRPQHALALARWGQTDLPAVLRRDQFAACQFHPEKSGPAGARLLENFLAS